MLDRLRDDEQIPAWAKTYVATAVMNGDIDGCSDGTAIVFDAQRGITAAEAAVMLSNFLDPPRRRARERLYSRLGVHCRVEPDVLRRVSGRQRPRGPHYARRGGTDAAGRI
ncbi:MAG: hypothetical protein ACLTG4_06185 [Oscillospiraceae bacterium]